MVIHSPKERPLIDEFGVAINPATYTLAAITEVSWGCIKLLCYPSLNIRDPNNENIYYII